MALSNQVLADRENDMWQQFKAQKGTQELDAQFEQDQPEQKPLVIERIIERVVVLPAAEPVPVMKPESVTIEQPEAEPVSQPAMVTVESNGYIFKLGSCKLAHRDIKCQLTITSIGKDGELDLYGNYSNHSSKLYDHNGNEYQPSQISMGNKMGRNHIRNKYISDVTAKGGIEFQNIETSTRSISMLELGLYNRVANKRQRIQFRDVTLSL